MLDSFIGHVYRILSYSWYW